jgi:hypothetical protein
LGEAFSHPLIPFTHSKYVAKRINKTSFIFRNCHETMTKPLASDPREALAFGIIPKRRKIPWISIASHKHILTNYFLGAANTPARAAPLNEPTIFIHGLHKHVTTPIIGRTKLTQHHTARILPS